MYKNIRSVFFLGILAGAASWLSAAEGRMLADVIEHADFDKAADLIASGANVDDAQPDGTTPLLWAAYHARSDLIESLVDKGANPSASNRYGIQAVYLASGNGDLESTKILIEAGADPGLVLPNGETLMVAAARSGNAEMVKYLVELEVDIDRRVANNQTALMWAASEGHDEVVNVLLSAGADPGAVSKNGFQPIHFAARAGHIPVVQLLLDAGVDIETPVNWSGPGGYRWPLDKSSPLVLAIENAHFELAVAMLEAGADPNDSRTGYAPLHTMSWVRKAHLGDAAEPEPPVLGKMSSREFLIKLIEHGADVDQRLLNGGGGPGRVREKGATPFFLAADRGDLEMMKLMVEYGADPHITNADGVTALMVAAGLGRGPENDEAGTQQDALAAVAYCLELGMDVNDVDLNNETAMHGAAYGQWPKMVDFLYENGADIEIWNNLNAWNWSPLLIAQGYRRGNFKPSFETIAAIEAIMAKENVTLRFDPPGPKIGYDSN